MKKIQIDLKKFKRIDHPKIILMLDGCPMYDRLGANKNFLNFRKIIKRSHFQRQNVKINFLIFS